MSVPEVRFSVFTARGLRSRPRAREASHAKPRLATSRIPTMIAAKQWAPDKPLPDPEQWLTRSLLESTLKDMKYVPTNLAAPTN